MALAETISKQGWSAWQLRYQGQWPASLLAAFYVLTGWSHPSVVLPVYAIAYGGAAACLANVTLQTGLKGRLAWLALGALALPSTVLIFGQPHKDAFALLGILMVAVGWVQAMLWDSDWSPRVPGRWIWLTASIWVIAGMGVMWLPRPYLTRVVCVALLVSAIGGAALSKDRVRWLVRAIPILVAACLSLGLLKQVEQVEQVEQVRLCPEWKPEIYIPVLHEQIGKLLCYRFGFVVAHAGQGANFDHDKVIASYGDLLAYLPTAAWRALLSPVPKVCAFEGTCFTTSPGGHVKRLAVAVEMALFYLTLLGLVAVAGSIGYSDRSVVVGLFIFAWTISMFYVISSPNEGVLYRERFPEMVIWWFLGVVGWARWFEQKYDQAAHVCLEQK